MITLKKLILYANRGFLRIIPSNPCLLTGRQIRAEGPIPAAQAHAHLDDIDDSGAEAAQVPQELVRDAEGQLLEDDGKAEREHDDDPAAGRPNKRASAGGRDAGVARVPHLLSEGHDGESGRLGPRVRAPTRGRDRRRVVDDAAGAGGRDHVGWGGGRADVSLEKLGDAVAWLSLLIWRLIYRTVEDSESLDRFRI